MAQQTRAWEFDLEEGMLDAGRLARVIVNPLISLSYKRERETDFRDTVVTLLIDNSGSMRGRPITVGRHVRRHPRPHPRALRGQSRDPRLHHPRLERRSKAASAGSKTASPVTRAASTTCVTSSTRAPTPPGAAPARTSA